MTHPFPAQDFPPYFTAKELCCKHCGEGGMDPAFMDVIMSLRERLDFPFLITSGYRCKSHPVEVKKKTSGAHPTGRAIDIAVSHEHALRLLQSALNAGISRIGVAQKGTASKRFIHLDASTNPRHRSQAIWSY
jgi:uncharacterized protein YcbK (DUF882 family)